MGYQQAHRRAAGRLVAQGVSYRSGFFEYAPGRALHYVATGADTLPTIYFFHGTPGAWHAFERYLHDADLLARYRLIAVDRPGFGYSQFGQPEALAEQSEVFLRLIKALHNQRPVLLAGHSLGGPIVVCMAAKADVPIAGVVLLAASVSPAHEPPEKFRRWLALPVLNRLLPGAFRPSNQELWWFKKSVLQMPDYLTRVTQPCYIVHGTKDPFVPYANAEYARQMLRHAASVQLLALEGANHFIPWQHYEQVKQVLLGTWWRPPGD